MPASRTPVVFVHGLWLHSTSWQPWVELFREAGYDPIAPEWPDIPDTVAEARTVPERFGGHGVADVTAHFAGIIRKLPTPPVVVGHSFGGLIVQQLLGQGLARAAVAIDPAPAKGVLALPVSALRVASVALRNPANRRRAVALTPAQFRYGFGNALSEAESAELYEKWTIPTPGRPLFEAATANLGPSTATKINTNRPGRGPLLITAGGRDHTVPPAISKGTARLYRKSPAVTDVVTFPDRGHSLTIDHGWREVAQTSLDWLARQSL
ncbi:alpha/beta hydrolase [Micromonospora chersina]|uniref:alpha/beta hydrolase n=1 Tax=Micromonospora chersina TaxID=47854 RepID=UPI003712F102